MSERGVFAVDRGFLDHPIFADEPFTEREAFLWILKEAAWKDRSRRIGTCRVELKRGQLAASIRFMAEAWKWHHSSVYRFLDKIEKETMIETDAKQGVTVITVCNYDRYQRVSLPDETEIETRNETAAKQQRNKQEDIKNIKLDEEEASARARQKIAIEIAMRLAELCGHDREFIPPAWTTAWHEVDRWLRNGWSPEGIFRGAQDALAKKRDGPPGSIRYFEKPIAEYIVRQSRPLPQVVIDNSPEKIHVRTETAGNLVSATDRILERMRELDEPSGSGEGGGRPLRMLPPVGRG